MAYIDDLKLALSGKEIASQRIAIIESTTCNDETSEQFSKRRREQYQKLLDRSEEKIAEIKSRIAEDIGEKKFQLEGYKNERTEVNTRYKLGEIPYEQHEKIENGIKKKFDKAKAEAEALQHLYGVSRSSEIGGQIPIDIEKDVDEFGNIIKKAGLSLPTNIPVNISMPDVSMPDTLRNISIPKLNLIRGNSMLLVGAIGGIVAILIIAFLFLNPVTVIQPDCGSSCKGYSWSGSTVTITAPGEYAFAKNANFPNKIVVSVESSGVTLDGAGVTILQIAGKPDLDLKNITIYADDPSVLDYAISECRNVENSSIVIISRDTTRAVRNDAAGIGTLYGKIDDITSITVTSTRYAYGVKEVAKTGIISGGTFTMRGDSASAGVGDVYGTISGGTFTVTGGDVAAVVFRLHEGGTISGGEFTVKDGYFATNGVNIVSGTISGGTFTMAGGQYGGYSFGVETLSSGGVISGGRFVVTNQNGEADGVSGISGTISGGTFTVNGRDWRP